MIVAVHQPQYLPWLGYFAKIDRADAFVLLDTVQYKKNEWQNRNKIRNSQNWQWLTVPVKYKFPQLIKEVPINNNIDWKKDHLKSLEQNYGKTKYFKDYHDFFVDLYNRDWQYLGDLNVYVVKSLAQFLGIKTEFIIFSQEIKSEGKSTDRLVNICRDLKADTYLSGAGGKDYLEMEKFDKVGINVIFQEYQHPQYQQDCKGFEPYMAVVDLLFNHGKDSLKIIRGK